MCVCVCVCVCVCNQENLCNMKFVCLPFTYVSTKSDLVTFVFLTVSEQARYKIANPSDILRRLSTFKLSSLENKRASSLN